MRFLTLALVTVVLAWGVWTFLREPAEEPVFEVAPPPETPEAVSVEDQRASDRARLTTGTLVVTVRDAKGAVPPGARAGYRVGGEERLRAVNAKGQARFTDAPLGHLLILARAPGFRADQQERPLQAGVRADVLFVLRTE